MTTADVSTFDDDAQLEQTHRNMAEAGVAIDTPQIVDYWSFSTVQKHMLPDGVQYILFKNMTEADKTQFQALTNRDIRVQNSTKDIKLKMDPGKERHVLMDICVTGWLLYRQNHKGQLVEHQFSQKAFAEWLKVVDPNIIQKLEKAIRDANPWMSSDLTVKEIDDEIEALRERRDEVEKAELEK